MTSSFFGSNVSNEDEISAPVIRKPARSKLWSRLYSRTKVSVGSNAEPATGLVAEPMYDNWFFNCSKCGFAIKVDQQPD